MFPTRTKHPPKYGLSTKKIKSYPTWLIDGQRYERILTVEALRKFLSSQLSFLMLAKNRVGMSKQPSIKMLTDPGHLIALGFGSGLAR